MGSGIPRRAIVFVALTAMLGSMALTNYLYHWESYDPLKFACYFVIAMLASTKKVKLPGIDGTMSVHFLFILLGVLELSPPETMVIGCAAAVLQSFWKTQQKPDPVKVVFNVLGMTANAIWVTEYVYNRIAGPLHGRVPLILFATASAYFLMNTLPLSLVIGFSQRSRIREIWSATYFWTFPYYLFGAALAGMISFCDRYVGWVNSLSIVPVTYWIFRTYYLYLARLECEKKRAEMEAQHVEAERRHVEEVCALHLRTIEGLALAIEAKDHSTHRHLNRVRTYAVGIGREMGLSDEE